MKSRSTSRSATAKKSPARKKFAGKKPGKMPSKASSGAAQRKPVNKGSKSKRGPVAKLVSKPAAKPVATKAAPKSQASRSPIVDIVLRAMEDMKAVNIVTLDVRGVTDVADAMVIASGNSDRHVRAISDRVREFAKQAGYRPMGVEGERDGEWVLVDLNDVIVHVMLPRVREFYRLESLWDVTAARREASGQ
jgi:ribosome-associated protein